MSFIEISEILYRPFEPDFMLRAFALGALIAAVCGVLSCYLVLRGWSLMGDAISHAVLPGIVLAYSIGLPLPVGAFASGLLCATGTGWIKRHTRVKEDTVMGVIFTGLFALGLVLFARTPSDLHLDHILFGNILGIDTSLLLQTGILALLILGVVLALRRTLMLATFDPTHATVIGINPRILDTLLLSLLALAIVAALQAVGIVLVIAMLVTPGATALLLTRRFDRMLSLAALVAVGSTLMGVYLSFHANASPSACIVLTQAAVFTAAMSFMQLRSARQKPAQD
jgi:ABC-type Mn2+/Zn2+ transport system permease subunit